jgi:dnd system-associated protein 4
MPEQTSRDDRVAIDPEMHEIFKRLSDGTDPEEVPFGQLKDVFLMAACLGYARKKRRPLPAKTRDIIRLETFSQSDLPVLYALAIATTGDVEILDQGYAFLTIAEEYANELSFRLNFWDNQRFSPDAQETLQKRVSFEVVGSGVLYISNAVPHTTQDRRVLTQLSLA